MIQRDTLLSPLQTEALSNLLKRMGSYLAWTDNQKNPAQLGFGLDQHSELSSLLENPQYATQERLQSILIPIQDHFFALIDEKGRQNQERSQKLQNLVGNVRPIFEDVNIPEATKLMQSCHLTRQKAEDMGYMLSLIANIINPPQAKVFHLSFAKA